MVTYRHPSYLLIVIGIIAILAPFLTGTSFVILTGMVLVFAGLSYGTLAFATLGTGPFILRLILAFISVIVGLRLVVHPAQALAGLTLIVAAVFAFEGVSELIAYLSLRKREQALWLLLNALITVGLAVMIWTSWPSSATWFLGTAIGLNLITSGLAPIQFFRFQRSR